MINVLTNAKQLAAKWRQRRVALSAAARKGRRNAAIAVDREQEKNLEGGTSAPGSYPVPVRTGNLRRGAFFDATHSTFAIVGNTAAYAMAIHSGDMTTKDGLNYSLKGRPFLDDAAEAVDVVELMAIPIRREVLAI